MIPIFLIIVLSAGNYAHYNAFAESSDNGEGDSTQEEKKDEVKCDDNEELKDGDCVPIKCDDNEELKDGDCVPIKCDDNEELKDGDCVPIKCDDNEELKDGDCVPIKCDDNEELKDGDCVPIKCDDNEELKDGDCVPISSPPELAESRVTTESVPSSSVLKLDSISDVKPGDPISVHGTLKTKSDGTGIAEKTLTLAGTGIETLPAESKSTRSEGDGKFTFTIPGNALVEGGLKIKAHFDGDDEYSKSDSNELTYPPKGAIPTTIELNPISNVNLGDSLTIQGTLKTKSDGTGIAEKTLTLAGTGIETLPAESKSTRSEGDGKFTFTIPGNALVEGGLKIKAHFDGDDEYSKSDSNELTYPPKGAIPTTIELNPISNVNLGDSLTIQGTLKTKSDGTGIAEKTLTLAGTGIETLPAESKTAVTEGDGKFTFTIPGNALVEGGLKIKAHFDGDDEYSKSDSNELTYPPKGAIPTTIELNPISNVNLGDSLTIQGTLKTKSDGTGIAEKTLTLAGTGIETLPAESKTAVTEGDGKFTFTIPGKLLPDVSRGTTSLDSTRPPIDSLKIKAHFNGDDEYSKSDSNELTYPPKGGIPTTIELNPISNVNLGDSLTIQGILKTKSDGTGIDGKTVTLTVVPVRAESTPTPGGPAEIITTPGVPAYRATTGDDGTFTFADVGPLNKGPLNNLGLWDFQANFGGDADYGPSGITTTSGVDIPQVRVPDAVLGEGANEQPAETKLPIPGPNDFKTCTLVSGPHISGDNLNEIEHIGNDFIYKTKEKGKSKTFEYSIFYDCPDIPGPGPDPGPNPPPAPVITSPVAGTQKTPISQISGNAEAGTTVEVSDGSKSLGTAPTTKGHWSVSTQLGDGTYSFTAKATDKAGNTGDPSAAVGVVVDTGPGAPVIDFPVAGTQKTPISKITGTAEWYTKVEVFNGGTSLGTNTGEDGKDWILELGKPLGEGTYSFTATATDAASNTGPASAAVEVKVDIPPGAPVITSPTAGTYATNTYSVAGTAEKDSTVNVLDGGSSIGTATAKGNGDWSLPSQVQLAEGTHSLTATATDAASNTGPASAAVEVKVDIPPGAPVITSPTAGTYATNTYSVAGTAEKDSTVNVLDGGSSIGTATAKGNGDWSLPSQVQLAEGTHSLTATATDAASNTGPASAAVEVKVDIPPGAPVITSPTAGTYATNTYSVAGTAEKDSTVNVLDGGSSIGTATAKGNGDWSLPSQVQLAEGTHSLTATATDAASNTGPASAAVEVKVDIPPGAPVITSPVAGTQKTPISQITGNAEAGSTVEVFNGQTSVGTAPSTNGPWSVSTQLGDGTYSFTAKATDAVANTGPASAPIQVVVDTTAPVAPVIKSPVPGTQKTPISQISGNAEAGTTVEVFDGSKSLGIAPTISDPDGNWWSLSTPIGDGTYSFTAKATDKAGNTGDPSAAVGVVVDTTGPGVPVITSPVAGYSSDSYIPGIDGTAEPGSKVEVFKNETSLDKVTTGNDGKWSLKLDPALGAGIYRFTAKATDAIGNTGLASEPVYVTVLPEVT